MTSRRSIALFVLVAALAGCAALPIGSTVGVTETVTLPDGETCFHAGRGATITVDGQRLGWTCTTDTGAPRGLFGQPFTNVADVSWRLVATERGQDGAWVAASSETVTGRVEAFQLTNGAACAFAGEGATLAFGDRRVNWACGDDAVAVGSLRADAAGLYVEFGRLTRDGERFELADARFVRLQTLSMR